MLKIKKYLSEMYCAAEELNTQNVISAIKRTGNHSIILDVGCWDGEATKKWAEAANASKVIGIEPIDRLDIKNSALSRNIEVHNLLADKDIWDIQDSSVDCVISNQVVEHLTDLDFYFSQANRVLKPGGYIITSTNNLSSLHNIFSLILGFAPFDLSNSSSQIGGLGNAFAVHRGERDPRGSSWTHKCVYTTKWLSDWQKLYGLIYEFHIGAGLYPFPPTLGKYISLYSAFITIAARKK